jgi:hypothetical protein
MELRAKVTDANTVYKLSFGQFLFREVRALKRHNSCTNYHTIITQGKTQQPHSL